MIELTCDMGKILEEVNVRTYYISEGAKQKDPDHAIIATSSDDETILKPFAEYAISLAKRYLHGATCDKSGRIVILVNTNVECLEEMKAEIERAIFEFVVRYVIWKWLLHIVRIDLANVWYTLKEDAWKEAKDSMSMLGMRIRRRATNLAGI